jgi:predicted ATPase
MGKGQRSIYIGPVDAEDNGLSISVGLSEAENGAGDPVPYIKVTMRSHTGYRSSTSRLANREGATYITTSDTLPTPFVKANGLDTAQISRLWDNIALTDLEGDVLDALRIIAPDVQRINLIGEEGIQGRIPIVKIASLAEPVPLRSLGEGMNRLFGLILAIVNAKDGLLLLDEVESGLHYSVLPEVWRLLFTVAQRLNVQVFATTHSWDCITAFQQAAAENAEEEGVLIRLEMKKGEIAATTFDESKLTIATREQIEVR